MTITTEYPRMIGWLVELFAVVVLSPILSVFDPVFSYFGIPHILFIPIVIFIFLFVAKTSPSLINWFVVPESIPKNLYMQKYLHPPVRKLNWLVQPILPLLSRLIGPIRDAISEPLSTRFEVNRTWANKTRTEIYQDSPRIREAWKKTRPRAHAAAGCALVALLSSLLYPASLLPIVDAQTHGIQMMPFWWGIIILLFSWISMPLLLNYALRKRLELLVKLDYALQRHLIVLRGVGS